MEILNNFAPMESKNRPRGRYAPSPTGFIHVGNARTALVAWLSIRSKGGEFVWRLEDIDTNRVVSGLAEAAEEDLRWLGLDWDEGPDRGGAYAPYVQSERLADYAATLHFLLDKGRVFPCHRSRKDLEAIASAPHGPARHRPYPASLRPVETPKGWLPDTLAQAQPDYSIRFMVDAQPVVFDDWVQGRLEELVTETVGDFVLRRRDGFYAYQLAVVVDDLHMAITEVVRGADLLDSTARQIQLIEALEGTRPQYAHVPLVLNGDGEKLSKRDDGLTLRHLRESGISPGQLTGYLAYSLGLLSTPRAVHPEELIAGFRWEDVGKEDWMLPDDFIEQP